ncbi:hypothetical protein [Cobetia sp. L2A1]|uniref:hypothetical protein n=1 Tax=Cobetia sp. L2A1 TaxID=2686360 RepID=UPI00131DDDCC|nr:hypothetical protein [Cobetia sp. L2A1]
MNKKPAYERVFLCPSVELLAEMIWMSHGSTLDESGSLKRSARCEDTEIVSDLALVQLSPRINGYEWVMLSILSAECGHFCEKSHEIEQIRALFFVSDKERIMDEPLIHNARRMAK